MEKKQAPSYKLTLAVLKALHMKKILLLAAALGLVWNLSNPSSQVVLGPGVMVPEIPVQENLRGRPSHHVGGYEVTDLASFSIKAKVLAKENYRMGREADLSPTDLALGWGNMSDERILQDIEISQSGRFYYWRVKSFPIPRKEIETHSANMHLIPASSSVKSDISSVRAGDIIELTGKLVEVMSEDGWRWKSSLTRNDTGMGACELIWVESIRVVTP
jgi:hypothetical protein